ncbi:MAG: PKD domain-containing protein [Aureispira sp.]|nr:PKD domain-containing protein [Aureispira sp.]
MTLAKSPLLFAFLLLVLSSNQLYAQDNRSIIQSFLDAQHQEQQLTKADVSDWIVTNQHTSKKNKVTYVYIAQQYQGIELSNGVANFSIKDGKVWSMGNRLISNLQQKVNTTTPSISPKQAIEYAATHLGLSIQEDLRVLEPISSKHFMFNKAGISLENIPVKLVFTLANEGEIRLSWDLSIYNLDAQDWWSMRIDAVTGKLIDKANWVQHCDFKHSPFSKCNKPNHKFQTFGTMSTQANPQSNSADPMTYKYNVFALPYESPNHGPRSIETNPADSVASPYGWHDVNGAIGVEYTNTRGNNVYAYEDVADNNGPGYSPISSGNNIDTITFDTTLDLYSQPNTYYGASVTNLFYMNNMIHDVWYRYGFDEASGNFQTNNYGRGGSAGDGVAAEAQDGGGTNNANFATPPDGSTPRMQMYVWNIAPSGSSPDYLTVNSPAGVAGPYTSPAAGFGASIPSSPITTNLVLAIDGTAPTSDGCTALTNGSAIAGKIAVIDRGGCNFVTKVSNAQAAGAVAVIVVNNDGTAPFAMGGTDPSITIPSIMISQADGNAIKAQMASGTVNATIVNPGTGIPPVRDGDFDNGIIAHEYGHGISTRLTGGGNNAGCLYNDEQMGEGWSDWFGLMMTMEAGDQRTDVRGYGTFGNGESVTGNGIRPVPYSTNLAVNNYTYGDVNNTALSAPHGVGFVWATALWEMTWDLIDLYGFDPDLYNGTGGNNIAMQLVIDGLKLQPCSPGMIDGRDAILQADSLNNGGANWCLIWEAFARRGFGYSADQGSSSSRTDQTEAFDLPPLCMTPITPPTAGYSQSTLNTCSGIVSFTDNSSNIAQRWHWDFGDGDTSNLANPSHTYTTSGTYTIKQVVSNTLGADSVTTTVTVQIPLPPTPVDATICAGNTAELTASGTGISHWYSTAGTLLHVGDTFTTPSLFATATVEVENVVTFPSQYVGPANGSIGNGGYHNTGFTGATNFTADRDFSIVSAWVDAGSVGSRTFYLWSGGANGTVVDQVTVNITTTGPQRVALNLDVPSAGTYALGGTSVDLYRNSDGATYPYTLTGFLTMTSSSATTSPADYFYYLYDWEIQETACKSPKVIATANVLNSSFNYAGVSGTTYNFTDNSTGATSWEWQFGDNNTSNAQNPTHSYSSPGTYTVILSINNGECSDTQSVNIVFVNVQDVNQEDLMIQLAPNPTQSNTVVTLNRASDQDIQIELVDINGRLLQQQQLPAGRLSKTLDLSELSPAVYWVRLRSASFTEVRKLLIQD